MTTITIQDVSAWTGRESAYLYLVGLTKAAGRHLALWIFCPPLFVMSLILAQAFPFQIRSAMRRINPVLPDVKNDVVLGMVRDMYRLTYGAAKFYSHLCVFRNTIKEVLEDLDESIDSLDFVLANDDELQDLVSRCESQQERTLPLPFETRAVAAG